MDTNIFKEHAASMFMAKVSLVEKMAGYMG
jgi:hypothetical protein